MAAGSAHGVVAPDRLPRPRTRGGADRAKTAHEACSVGDAGSRDPAGEGVLRRTLRTRRSDSVDRSGVDEPADVHDQFVSQHRTPAEPDDPSGRIDWADVRKSRPPRRFFGEAAVEGPGPDLALESKPDRRSAEPL